MKITSLGNFQRYSVYGFHTFVLALALGCILYATQERETRHRARLIRENRVEEQIARTRNSAKIRQARVESGEFIETGSWRLLGYVYPNPLVISEYGMTNPEYYPSVLTRVFDENMFFIGVWETNGNFKFIDDYPELANQFTSEVYGELD